MPRPLTFRLSSYRIRTIAIVLAVAALAVGAAVGQAAQSSKRVATTAENPTLGKTVLTTVKGQTLYSLSAEKNGRFICTGSCLSVWHPLRVPSGTRPTGPVKLGTIERPEGGTQVTYRGKPLYHFSGDAKTGDANGEGIKDVGTWHAATAPSAPIEEPAPQPQPQPENPYPYSY
jgi:predicted lipoprotein with Yx(FWY)xxD motif